MSSKRNGAKTVDAVLRQVLTWRCIGPHRGGRVVAVAADPLEPMTFSFGACAGGVWKSTDGGVYWENLSDGLFTTTAVGAIAVAESDPNVLYVAPSNQAMEVYTELAARIDRQLRQFDDVMEADLATFNRLVRDAGVVAIVLQA